MLGALLLIAVAALVIVPVAALVPGFGGAIAPIGPSLVIGAFVFGIGMQLANGCGSGTLYTAGGGSGRMLIALALFIVGSVIGSLHLPAFLRARRRRSDPRLELFRAVGRACGDACQHRGGGAADRRGRARARRELQAAPADRHRRDRDRRCSRSACSSRAIIPGA